ncbi:MAG: 16S rRNA (cytosine(1402)-N(4))-methyltransferase RsmH [Rhodoplanes sp.]
MAAEPAHVPVMLAEVLAFLSPRAGACYVDATFGAGGYAIAILDAAECRVFGIDRDPAAVARAAAIGRNDSGSLQVLQGVFGDMEHLLTEAGADRVDGIVFDLGMSSIQLDAAERGFSFRAEGPLDMRMDPGAGATAADVVNTLPEEGLANILYAYGEERAARRIARLIVQSRRRTPFVGTRQLADLVRGVVRKDAGGIDPATRTFQALRIYVNDEMKQLDRGLCAAERLLAAGGRLCVVAYHSLEDRKVKAFLRVRSGSSPRSSRHAPDLPAGGNAAPVPSFRLLHRGAVRPSAAEVAANPRARSARLRAAERTAAPPWPGTPSTRRAA